MTEKSNNLITEALDETAPIKSFTIKTHYKQEIRLHFKDVYSQLEELNLYSGTKHIPLSSQRPFHFPCSVGALYQSDQTNQDKIRFDLRNDNLLFSQL